jgi:hypothetical protein
MDTSRSPPLEQLDMAQDFDILEWFPYYQKCQQVFINHSQHHPGVQALCAFMNILLPYQWHSHPVYSMNTPTPGPGPARAGQSHPSSAYPGSTSLPQAPAQFVSLIHYLRRLIVTGFDTPEILTGFFGDDWQQGLGHLHEMERRNFLFAAKSLNWLETKRAYEPTPMETIPFMKSLREPTEAELQQADTKWGEWLAMQDWTIGPRLPDCLVTEMTFSREFRRPIKKEPME